MDILLSIFSILFILSVFASIVFGILWLVFRAKKMVTKSVKLGTLISIGILIVSFIGMIFSYNLYQKQQDKLISQANKASEKAYATVIAKSLDAQSNIVDINNDVQNAWTDSISDYSDDDFNDNVQDTLTKDLNKNLDASSDISDIDDAITTMKNNKDYSDDEYTDKIKYSQDAKKALNHYYHLVDSPSGNIHDFSSDTSDANNAVNELEIFN